MLARVQRKSCSKEIWFHFHSVKSKCDHAKVILVSTTPFEMLEKASFWIPKDTFQSIKKDFTPLVLWRAPISLLQVVAVCESKFYSKCQSFSLHTSPVDNDCDPQLVFWITFSRIPLRFWLNKSIIVWVSGKVSVSFSFIFVALEIVQGLLVTN